MNYQFDRLAREFEAVPDLLAEIDDPAAQAFFASLFAHLDNLMRATSKPCQPPST